jgi:hypothetical protein
LGKYEKEQEKRRRENEKNVKRRSIHSRREN